ncbi:MAG: DNA polymerase/3'-5' exonuclease PolX [Syntrophobacterales bacterium]|jgi:DNA polymerase (family 10)
MPVHNRDIAEIFNKVADLLEIEGANQFRVRAYRNAARTIGDLPQSAADLVEKGEDLSKLSGIGQDLAGKIAEIVETGELGQLKELESRTPADLGRMMDIAGLGPKRVQTLHANLGINSLDDLRKAVQQEKIQQVPGFGVKTEKKILQGLAGLVGKKKRFGLKEVEEIAQSLLNHLQKVQGIKEVVIAGSYRRRQETVGDLDILATCKKGSQVMEAFVKHEDVEEVVSQGKTRSTVMLRSGLQVDLRVLAQVSFGAALHYFTGSKSHNIAVRKLGVHRGLKINEYGVFQGEKRLAGQTEAEVYAQVDLPYIEPELRENRGEIEAAQKGKLPQLITLDDIRGDLHTHTKVTDGRNTLAEMAEAAQERGYDYLAITNHSQRVTMTHGLDAQKLRQEMEKIDKFNDNSKGIRVLKAIEVDILEDGSLDLPDEVLKDLDLTVCSVHYNWNMSRKDMTERIIRAMDNPYFHILGHPTGRLIGKREPYDVDMEKILEAARERGCFLELDSQPDRLDLSDVHCKLAKDLGVKIAISTDAHSVADLDYLRFGIGQARRGWLEPEDVLNTRTWRQLKRLLPRT